MNDIQWPFTTAAEAYRAGKREGAKRAWDSAMLDADTVSAECEDDDDLQGMRAAEKVRTAIAGGRDQHLALLGLDSEQLPSFKERNDAPRRRRVLAPSFAHSA